MRYNKYKAVMEIKITARAVILHFAEIFGVKSPQPHEGQNSACFDLTFLEQSGQLTS